MRHTPFSSDPYHNPLHNIVVPYKPWKPQLALINCLTCGKPIRLGNADESPHRDRDKHGGVDAKRWFCNRQCLKLYAAMNRQQVKNPKLKIRQQDWIVDILNRDYTGGASPER